MNEVLKPLAARQDNVNCSEKKLLHFGRDWITFYIAPINTQHPPKSIQFLDSLFRIPHNDTNDSEYDDFVWGDTDTEVMLKFTGETQMGEALFINGQKGKSLLRVIKIDKDKPQVFSSIAKYKYRVDCYGTMFDYDRLGLLDAESMLSMFISDIEKKLLNHTIGRVDPLADLAGYQVSSIKRGIVGSKAHMKKMTVFNTANPETLNYGDKKSDWMARAYNKLLDAQKKKKEWILLKLGYFDYKSVTRLEVEAHSDICLSNSLTLPLCFNNEYLFGIYKTLLHTKFVQFKVIPFIESELKKTGFQIITPVKRKHDPKTLSDLKYSKLAASYVKGFMERCDIPFDEAVAAIRLHIEPQTGISSNPEALATAEDIRTIFSCK